jgi:xylulokinase
MTAGPPGEPYVLAVDLGTSGPKVALVTRRGRLAAHARRPVGLRLLPGGGAEQDPAEWWRALVDAVGELLGSAQVAAGDVAGLGCTAQWSGTVACGPDGSALRPALIWMDSRGAPCIRRRTTGPLRLFGYDVRKAQRWIRLTGGAPGHSGKDPVAHILWMAEAEPELYRATEVFLEPVDWLVRQLTGRAVASYDSIAAHWVTDNRRIGAVRYDETLLSWSGLERAKLPDLVPSASVAGRLTTEAAEQLGLPPGLPVASGTGDLHSAAVGSGALEDFDAHLYIGTSSWISCHVPFKKTDPLHNVASIPSALPGRYLVADEHETAGACLDFVARQVLPGAGDDRYRRLEAMARSVPAGAGKTLFTPWLNGERSPVDDHTIRGGFHNLSLSTTPEQLVRAVYEGVALNSRWLLGAVERFVGRRFESLAFVGGGANSELWAQLHADVTGRRVRQVAEPALANVRGAGLLAWLAMGEVEVEDMAAAVEVGRSFEPDPSARRVYDELYREFVQLYERTKAIHRRLNGAARPGGRADGARPSEAREGGARR